MVTNLQKGLVLPDPGEVPSLSGKTLWKYQREARCHINTVMISPEFLPRAGVTRKQRKWWHILTQDPGKSNPDILFRARDSSSANYRGKRRACFSQRRLRLRSLPKQPRQWSSGPRGPKELFIYELKPLRIKRPPLFCRRHERHTDEDKGKESERWRLEYSGHRSCLSFSLHPMGYN